MKVINFGSCNIDYVYSMDHIVIPGETQPSTSLDIFPGGKGLNQSIAAARAGARVYHAGAVGEDGDMLRRVLAENGVDLTHLAASADRSGHAIIQLSAAGENSILLYQGANGTLTCEYVDEVLSHFTAGDLLLLQNETNLVPYIIERAAARGLQILFNPAPFTEELASLDYNKITYLVLNEIEARGLGGAQTPAENLQRLRERYPQTNVVMTLGGEGCVCADTTHTFSYPAFSVEVVDTTAAGDTFIGYFLAGVVRGATHEEAIEEATAASAIAVSRKGAAPSIPQRDEVLRSLGSMKPSRPPREDRIRYEINAYLEEHLADARLAALAEKLGYAETYAGELVHAVMGESFSTLLQGKRCEVAALMLRETDLPVEEIIARVGYHNGSFFRALFKEKYGTSPHRYRKNKGGNV